MPATKFKIDVPFDNDVRSGDVTLDEILTDCGALAGVDKILVQRPIRDKSTNGSLIEVRLKVKAVTGVTQAQLDAIEACIKNTPGVVGAPPLCPPQLLLGELNATTGLVYSAALGGSEEWTLLGASLGNILGFLQQTGGVGVGTYGTFGLTVPPDEFFLQIQQEDLVNALTWPTSTTLTLTSVSLPSGSLVLTPAADIVLPASTGFFNDFIEMYVSTDGQLFEKRRKVDGDIVVPERTFAEACSFPL